MNMPLCCDLPEGKSPTSVGLSLFTPSSVHDRLVKRLDKAGYHDVAMPLAECCSFAIPSGKGKKDRIVTVVERGTKRSIAGLVRCKKAWCPICSPVKSAKVAQDLEGVIEHCETNEQLSFWLVTVTIKHDRSDSWRSNWQAIRDALRTVVQNTEWGRAVRGYIKVLHSTYGKHGHHVHYHLLLALKSDLDISKFFVWFQETYEGAIWLLGREAKLAKGWSIPIDRKDLKRQIGYLISGTGQTNAGGKAKRADGKARHPALFDLPLHALAEIARSSSGIHWLDAGGIFSKSARKEFTTSTDALPAETIGWMHGRVWNRNSICGRHLQIACQNPSISRDAFLAIWIAAGGQSGSPPPPPMRDG